MYFSSFSFRSSIKLGLHASLSYFSKRNSTRTTNQKRYNWCAMVYRRTCWILGNPGCLACGSKTLGTKSKTHLRLPNIFLGGNSGSCSRTNKSIQHVTSQGRRKNSIYLHIWVSLECLVELFIQLSKVAEALFKIPFCIIINYAERIPLREGMR
jgi:hypothetical protein